MLDLLGYLRERITSVRLSPGGGLMPKEYQSIGRNEMDAALGEGLRLAAANDHAGALTWFEKVLKKYPDSALAYCHAGMAAFAVGELDTAKDHFTLSLHYDNQNPGANIGMAKVLRATGHSGRAEDVLRRLVAYCPDLADAWFELACCQHVSGAFGRAVASLREALKSAPSAAHVLNLLGLITAREFGSLEEGEAYVRRALDCSPGFAAALSNLGWILAEQGRLDEAVFYLDRVLDANPKDQETRLMRAHAHLKHGNFAAGWTDFAARHASPLALRTPFNFPELGIKDDKGGVVGKRVLIYAEQGLGDQIMFASCLPDFLAAGGQCTLECDEKLETLFRRSFPDCAVVPKRPGRTPAPKIFDEEIDLQLPIGDLPSLYRLRADDFPVHHGYLCADRTKVTLWRRRLADTGPGPYVGISWNGGAQSTRRHLRSVPLPLWKPILSRPVQFISLQYGQCEEDIGLVKQAGFRLEHWPDAISDYDETAALVAALDLVISVCTAVVHLGGALGKPVWVLTPAAAEWRYGWQGRALPWYPSATLFRQVGHTSWSGVVDEVARALDHFCPT